ncbi:hypothetical protein IWX75_003561 [Arthrobacter sp. CAN_A6]|uniref:maltokinase N-terminal cap-like domain-containing protein n=1 Tax=Arthrobacter sp. CAN_A6 TaxID=2787721 RepID=UPI0018CBD05F
MALIYEVPLHPTKLELLARWLPAQPWFRGVSVEHMERVASFRFDDPAGEVGIEVLLIAVETALFQVPLTYRGSPLANKDEHLVGTLEHAVLASIHRC